MSRPFPVPVIVEGALSACTPHVAESEVQQALGYPGELVENWHERAIGKLGELVDDNRALKLMLDACTHCGACTDKCHYFLGSGDPYNMPVARQDLLRSVYRRHFTFSGRWLPWLVGARELDEPMLEDWYRYFHQCSECRRCAAFCPHGVDTAEISMAAREVLASIGKTQRYTSTIIGKAETIGNNLGIKPPALRATLSELEDELEEELGVPIPLPLDDPRADILVVVPSADFFAEPHIDGLMGLARVLHAAGAAWTLSSSASEAANFALFTGSHEHMRRIAERIVFAARDLGVQHVVIGECGHAWRVAYSQFNALVHEHASARPLRVEHVCELSYRLWQSGQIAFDSAVHADKVVTFHDSCNVARGGGMGGIFGGQFKLPRALLGAACEQVVEMPASSIGATTFCCGGGGGTLADELMPLREAGAAPRADALRVTLERDKVTHIVAICAICKTQFSTVLPRHELANVEVVGLHQLLGEAVLLPERF